MKQLLATNIFAVVLLITGVSAQAGQVQTCTRVDDADDWSLTFDFAKGEVALWDNDTQEFGRFSHTVETVEGVDVFTSDIKGAGRWTAEFYGDRTSTGNKAVLITPTWSLEFVCKPQ